MSISSFWAKQILDNNYTGIRYIGALNENNDYTEFGTLYYDDGTTHYEGSFMNGKAHGNGRLFSESGLLVCDGQFSEGDFIKGDHNIYDQDGNIVEEYTGNFQDSERNGQGILIINNNEKYEGEFKDNILVYGKHFLPLNDSLQSHFMYYLGSFNCNREYHGSGILFDPRIFFDNTINENVLISSISFEGDFKNHKKNGFGKIYNSENFNLIYQGYFYENKESFSLIKEGLEKSNFHLFKKVPSTHIKEYAKEYYNFDAPTFLSKAKFFSILKQYRYLNKGIIQNSTTFVKYLTKKFLIHYVRREGIVFRDEDDKRQLWNLVLKHFSQEEASEETFDLFGNSINDPVLGSDGDIYDRSSMLYLFQKNKEERYVNIAYVNNEPQYPRTSKGRPLVAYEEIENK